MVSRLTLYVLSLQVRVLSSSSEEGPSSKKGKRPRSKGKLPKGKPTATKVIT